MPRDHRPGFVESLAIRAGGGKGERDRIATALSGGHRKFTVAGALASLSSLTSAYSVRVLQPKRTLSIPPAFAAISAHIGGQSTILVGLNGVS